jgi:hypothetical protein
MAVNDNIKEGDMAKSRIVMIEKKIYEVSDDEFNKLAIADFEGYQSDINDAKVETLRNNKPLCEIELIID